MSRRPSAQSGYSLVELVITLALLLIVTAWAMPSFLSYYRSARVRSGAQMVSAYLNQGRQLAIKTNTPVCVSSTTSAMQFRQSTCGGATISVPGLVTSGNNIPLPENISLSSTASPIFGNLGNANPGATYTVTDTVSSNTLHVTVAGSGRITVDP